LRERGYVCVRNGTRETDFPHRHFFPGLVPLIDSQLPSREDIKRVFVAAGFGLVMHRLVTQVVAPDWPSFVEKSALRADSFLVRLADEDFEGGNSRITVPRRADRAERCRHRGNRLVRPQTARLSGPRTPMPNRLLRDYRDDDAAAVDRLAIASFEQFRSHYSDWPAMTAALGRISALAGIGEIVGAERDNRIVGAVAYIPASRPKASFFDRSWLIIRMLVVDPASRGGGLGRALTEECIDRACRGRIARDSSSHQPHHEYGAADVSPHGLPTGPGSAASSWRSLRRLSQTAECLNPGARTRPLRLGAVGRHFRRHRDRPTQRFRPHARRGAAAPECARNFAASSRDSTISRAHHAQ
jgi:predicted N-acetyltransferase YhbS